MRKPEGEGIKHDLARRYGCEQKTVCYWVAQYKSDGEEVIWIAPETNTIQINSRNWS